MNMAQPIKTPKSKLNELVDASKKSGTTLNIVETTDTKNGNGIFEFTCKFIRDGITFEGKGQAPSKKAAEHSACQEVLDKLNASENNAGGSIETHSIQSKLEQHHLIDNGKTYVISSSHVESAPSTSTNVNVIAAEERRLDPMDVLEAAVKGNKIGELGEFCAKNKLGNPDYSEEQWIGTDKTPEFKITCKLGNNVKHGIASVKMNAKKIAAYKLLVSMQASSSMSSPGSGLPRANLEALKVLKKVTDKIVYYTNVLIGEGGTAQVYEGYFENPIRKAAVKVCPKELVHHEKNKELDIMRKLDNPNIVSYFITVDIGPTTYIVMELADRTLEDWINSNEAMDSKLLKKIATDTTRGLIALHEAKIVHRDLKSSNVLIFCRNTNIVAKLADFGISKELDSVSEGVVTEAFRGTRIWMPPEGLKAIGSSIPFILLPSFDIFSLGLTIFFTMTKGRHLFASENNQSHIQIQANIVNSVVNWELISENEHCP